MAVSCEMKPGKALVAADESGVPGPPATNGERMQMPALIDASHVRLNCHPVFGGLPTARRAKPGAWFGLDTWSRKNVKLAGELNARLKLARQLLFAFCLYVKATRGENCVPMIWSFRSPRIAAVSSRSFASG